MSERFAAIARRVAILTGRWQASAIAVLIIVLWAVSGPLFGFSSLWQLAINTGTTIVTFVLLFIVQNTQATNETAMHLKLDEIIRSQADARNAYMGLERASEAEIAAKETELHGGAT